MPEGHTIHRHARLQSGDLAGRRLGVASPQGWAQDAASELDGRLLDRIDAYGKHLLYRFEGERTLQVHLGLFGRFRRWKDPAPPPRDTTRLRFTNGERTVDLSGAIVSALIEPDAEATLLARLGPDPLRADADPEQAWERLRRRRVGLGAALLDQTVIAGLGNVYRAEILFACALDPETPGRDLSREQFDRLWETTVALLRRGERSGRIAGKRVYRRARCGGCGGPTQAAKVAGRTLYWCPACQC